ncbi:MAG: PfkB family carbohydrate kinase [Caldilineaceae bacterium]
MPVFHSVDLICVGIACYDLVFEIPHHPHADEKITAETFIQCGGGTAANAAVAAARLGHSVAYAGYLGNDLYGDRHVAEFEDEGVVTHLIARGDVATSISSILVKPNGQRTIVNYKEPLSLAPGYVDLGQWQARAVLFDGHHLELSQKLMGWAKERGIPTVIDADRAHAGCLALANQVDYLVASERFAREVTHQDDFHAAAQELLDLAPHVVITLGERGLVWATRQESGAFPAFPVTAVDTTGAGDAFHGAFAAGVAAGYDWNYLLAYASATGALCATVTGARVGMPTKEELARFLAIQRGA